MTERKATRRRRKDPEFPCPEKPCCCPPRVKIWGSTTQVLTPLTNQMMEDEDIQLRADANAAVNPPGGPQVNADGSGGGQFRTRLRRDVDMVAVEFTRRWEWKATGDCKLAARVDVAGDVSATLACAPCEGHVALTMRRLLKASELDQGPRGSATATVTVIDCCGESARCELTLLEA